MERLLRDIYDAIGSLRQRISYLETQDGIADQSDAISFVQLTDAPDDYIGQSGKVVAVTAGEDGLEFVAGGGGGVEEFTDLTDTPENYTGHGGKVVAVNVGETGLEFVAGGGALADHDHSGDAGDGGTFDAANLTSGAAADGYVLTADGSGGAAWEVVSGGASELDDLTDVDLTTPPSDGQALVFDSGSSTWKAETLAGGVTDFLDLTDTPGAYTADKVLVSSSTGVIFSPVLTCGPSYPGLRIRGADSVSAGQSYLTIQSAHYAGTQAPFIRLVGSRGSHDTPLPTQTGDQLGAISFGGVPTDTIFAQGASIRAYADDDATDFRLPGRLELSVHDGTPTPVVALVIRSTGLVGINEPDPEGQLHVGGEIALEDITTPDTPSADTHKVYTKSDGLYVLNSAGTEVGPLGSGSGATELSGLTDVDLTTPPTDGQVLTYDDGSETWQASTIAAGAALTVKEADGTPEVADVGTIVVTNGTLTDDGGGQITLDFGSAATDGSAIHDNVSGEIAALTEKTTPVSADLLIIEDSAASNAKKKVQIGNLPGGSSPVSIFEIWLKG